MVIGERVLRLLQALGAKAGVLLVLDDMQWADPESLAVLEYLTDHAQEIGHACVATARPDESSGHAVLDALVAGRAVGVKLPALDQDEVRFTARDCLGITTLPEALAELIDRADGVPFLVEELLTPVRSWPAAGTGRSIQEQRRSCHGHSPNRLRNVRIPSTPPYALFFG